MPTGYTATLVEKGQTFQEFIMGCARAFDVLVEMRDSPIDAKIPDKFEPSNYYAEKLVETKEKLKLLKAMTGDEKEIFGDSKKETEIKRYEKYLEEYMQQNSRLLDMAAQVRKWNPPTKDHIELKKFMLQQIDISMHKLEYTKNSLKIAIETPIIEYYNSALSETIQNIQYYTEENQKEIDRVNKRTEWIQKLRESI